MNRHARRIRSERCGSNDRGASLVEYVMMLSLIVLVALSSVSAFGTTLGDSVDNSASRVVSAGP